MVANQNVVLFYRISVPVGPWVPRKILLSSKMMNYQPLHIQKRERVDIQKIKHKYKLKKKPWAIQSNQKMLEYKDTCYSWTELNTDNSKIGPWGRDLLGLQFKYLFSFFLGLSATIPLVRPRMEKSLWLPTVTNSLMCSKKISQKRNESIDKNQWHNILLNL